MLHSGTRRWDANGSPGQEGRTRNENVARSVRVVGFGERRCEFAGCSGEITFPVERLVLRDFTSLARAVVAGMPTCVASYATTELISWRSLETQVSCRDVLAKRPPVHFTILVPFNTAFAVPRRYKDHFALEHRDALNEIHV
jgi:hypothetical protein